MGSCPGLGLNPLKDVFIGVKCCPRGDTQTFQPLRCPVVTTIIPIIIIYTRDRVKIGPNFTMVPHGSEWYRSAFLKSVELSLNEGRNNECGTERSAPPDLLILQQLLIIIHKNKRMSDDQI